MINKAKKFRGILHKMQAKEGKSRYKDFLERHDANELFELMKKSTHSKIWEGCVVQCKAVMTRGHEHQNNFRNPNHTEILCMTCYVYVGV